MLACAFMCMTLLLLCFQNSLLSVQNTTGSISLKTNHHLKLSVLTLLCFNGCCCIANGKNWCLHSWFWNNARHFFPSGEAWLCHIWSLQTSAASIQHCWLFPLPWMQHLANCKRCFYTKVSTTISSNIIPLSPLLLSCPIFLFAWLSVFW